jgi:two-component system chemotaxis sensor kinase CheA
MAAENEIRPMMERLAGLAMMADAQDADSLSLLSEALSRVVSALEGEGGPLLERGRALAEIVAGLTSEPGESAAGRLDEALAGIEELQRALESAEARGVAAKDGTFALPSWVEEPVFREFLAGTGATLEEIETDMLALEQGDRDTAASLRRKVHTLKGESGVLGLSDVERLCHALEDLLADEETAAGSIDRMLAVKDWLQEAFAAYAESRLPSADVEALIVGLRIAAPQTASTRDEGAGKKTATAVVEGAEEEPEWDEDTFQVAEEFLQESDEGLVQVDDLLLEAEKGGADAEKVNALFRVFHTIKGVSGFLSLKETTELAHASETLLNLVRERQLDLDRPVLDLLFEATKEMRAMLEVLREAIPARRRPRTMASVAGIVARLRSVSARSIPAPPAAVVAVQAAPARVEPSVAATPVQPAQKAQADAPGQGQAKAKLKDVVKVDLERVDSLVGLIGELVIVESMIANSPDLLNLQSANVRKHISQMSKITRDLQDISMRMRMVPVRGVFQKMARMVRDISRTRGKEVRTVLQGEATEMDRSMVEQISDPLVHMIRNSVDHGIEEAGEREAAGKPRDGIIALSAYHQGGSVVIEVKDDGRGLDRERILAKARERGLVSENDKLGDHEIYNLIFLPGFSTAREVTEISGRGVGMDVVRRNIEAMRGKVKIDSVPGAGTTFTMLLPLTLAIIDGMLIVCGDERYIIPSLSVIELIQPEQSAVYSLAGRGRVARVRDEILPVFSLSALLEVEDAKDGLGQALIVVVESQGRKIGLIVDDVLAQQQVVIKGLGAGLPGTGYLSGSAILSDGRVGLILNPDEIPALCGRANGGSRGWGAHGDVPQAVAVRNSSERTGSWQEEAR